MSRIKQLPSGLQENLVSVQRGALLATALYWEHSGSVVVDLYISGLGKSQQVVLIQTVRSALSLAERDPEAVVGHFVASTLELCERAGPLASDGIFLNRVLGPAERAQVLTAQLRGHDIAQRFPSSKEPVERSAALYNFALNFLPSTITEFIAAYEEISVSAFKSRLNRAREAGLLASREERFKGKEGANAR